MLLIPSHPSMTPVAQGALAQHVALFEAVQDEGSEYVPILANLAAFAMPTHLIFDETLNAPGRAMRVAIAAAALWVHERPREVAFLCDSFMSTAPPGGSLPEGVRPRDDPGALECLMIVYAHREGTGTIALPYGRRDDGRFYWHAPTPWMHDPATLLTSAAEIAVGKLGDPPTPPDDESLAEIGIYRPGMTW